MYIPRVLLCGNEKNFSGLNIKIVGKISFKGAAERGEFFLFTNLKDLDNLPFDETKFQIFLDGKEISADELKRKLGIRNEKNPNSYQLTATSSTLLDDAADYILFESSGELIYRFNELYKLGLRDRFLTRETFLNYATENFYSLQNAETFGKILRQINISRLLDADIFLVRNNFIYAAEMPVAEIHALDKNLFAEKFPGVENLYKKIYRTLDECRFKFFDAVLLTAERSPEEFIDALIETDSLTEKIFTFVRKNSALEKFLATNENAFEKISRYPAVNGSWILLKKFSRADFKIYVVTHKAVEFNSLPEGYEIIDARKNLGDNIGRLNRYLNEITAIYWLWKNTSHSIIGLCHYRRFFTLDGENFLTEIQARELLKTCDIVVVAGDFFILTQRELKTMVCGGDLNDFVEKIFRKHIALKQPDYLGAFDYVSAGYSEFMYEMFITRRKIFDAYCEWLFSFVLDVTEEVLAKTNLAEIENPRKYRVIGLISERLMTVWLMKNNLKIKTLPIIFRDDV